MFEYGQDIMWKVNETWVRIPLYTFPNCPPPINSLSVTDSRLIRMSSSPATKFPATVGRRSIITVSDRIDWRRREFRAARLHVHTLAVLETCYYRLIIDRWNTVSYSKACRLPMEKVIVSMFIDSQLYIAYPSACRLSQPGWTSSDIHPGDERDTRRSIDWLP